MVMMKSMMLDDGDDNEVKDKEDNGHGHSSWW